MGVLTGPAAFVRAAGLFAKHPRLVVYASVPAVVTFLLSIAGIYIAFKFGDALLTSLWTQPDEGFWRVIWSVFSALSLLSSLLMVLVVTPWLVMLVGLPLCEPLAVQVDGILQGRVAVGGGISAAIGDIVNAIMSTLGILAIGLTGAIVFFILGLIPGVGIFAGLFVTFVWTPLFLAFDLVDSSLSRRRFRFRRKLGVVRKHLGASLGLGLTATPLLSIPVINLVGLPVAVAAGVCLVAALEESGRLE